MKNEQEFKKELESLINRFSIENWSDTPDYFLAEYLVDCLKTHAAAVKNRDRWYDFTPWGEKIK